MSTKMDHRTLQLLENIATKLQIMAENMEERNAQNQQLLAQNSQALEEMLQIHERLEEQQQLTKHMMEHLIHEEQNKSKVLADD